MLIKLQNGAYLTLNMWLLVNLIVVAITSASVATRSHPLNHFNVEFLKQFRVTTNRFYSPISILNAFATLIEGSDGDTRKQLIDGLNLKGLDIREQFRKLNKVLNRNSHDYELRFANLLAINDKFRIRDEFKSQVINTFDAVLKSMDFEGDGAKCTAELNQWTSNRTEGEIERILSESITGDTALMLVNAIYFKGSWKSKFDEKLTKKDTFHGSRSDSEVMMMFKKAKLKGSMYNRATLVHLPYLDNMSMIVALPNESEDVTQWLRNLNSAELDNMVNEMVNSRPMQTELWMPKFKLSSKYDLKQIMSGLGVVNLFDRHKCDLSKITGDDDLFVSHAVHQAVLDVNEQGSAAAAATAVRVMVKKAALVESEVVVIRVDRPFLIMIRCDVTGLVLFTGIVFDL